MSSWSRSLNPIQIKPLKKPRKENTIIITVCVNFADKLQHTMEFNSQYVKKIYVVTDPKDKETLEVCKGFNNVEILLCGDAHKNGAKFNKSGLIKSAQVKIHPNHREDWIAIIDADTILPVNFWTETINLHPQFFEYNVYLLKRKIYMSNEELKNNNPTKIQHGCGFFQLYYSKNKMYSDYSDSAAECDILFQQLFRNQIELKGYCIHLGQNGMDWNGRVSQLWSPI
jgi:hypothetical protein